LIDDRDKLLKQNIRLRSEITEMQGVVSERHTRILEKESELNILREQLRVLKEGNEQLKRELEESKKSRMELTEKVLNLELQLEDQKLRLEYKKFLIAIQDINRLHQLEDKVFNLYKLRKQRVGISHFIYIDDRDASSLQKYKASFALTQIQDMSTSCQDKFRKKFGPNFLSQFSGEVKKIGLVVGSVSDDEIAETVDWWNE
jgi:hypothetical protein